MAKYTHDCNKCRSLGVFTSTSIQEYETIEFDLYVCRVGAEGILGATIIARYGNRGYEYASTPVSLLQEHETRMKQNPATCTLGLLEGLDRYRNMMDDG